MFGNRVHQQGQHTANQAAAMQAKTTRQKQNQ